MTTRTRTVKYNDLRPGMVIVDKVLEYLWPEPKVVAVDTTTSKNVYIFNPSGGLRAVDIPEKVRVANRKTVPLKRLSITQESIVTSITTIAGTDPEVFVVDNNGDVIPSWEFMPKKDHPIVGTHESKAFYDGFQSEFTVTASSCHGHLTDYVRSGLQSVLVQARRKNPTARLTIASAVHTPRERLMELAPEHVQLGCSPSLNVYDEPPMDLPDPIEWEYRCAGCHLHYGSSKFTNKTVPNAIRMLDATAGVANVALGDKYLTPERRRYYGRAGEYRYHENEESITRYNRLEWRVPDTILLAHPATWNLMIDLARVAVQMGSSGLLFLWQAEEQEVRDAINYCDVELARKILKRNESLLRVMLSKQYTGFSLAVDYAVQAFMNGIDSVIANPTDVESNWELGDMYPRTNNWWHGNDYTPSCQRGKMWAGAAMNFLIQGKKA